MELLVVTAAAVIVFLLVEGSKTNAQPPSQPAPTGSAGASGNALPPVDTSTFDSMFGPPPTGDWNSPAAAAADNADWGVDPFRPSQGG